MLRWCRASHCLFAARHPRRRRTIPNKPVRVIASSSAGGISDIFIRIVGEELHKKWGQPLVVENRPGGQFNIGAKACADAAPDGYTICILPSDVLQYNRHVIRSLNYDLFKDLEPVSLLFFLTQSLVVSSSLNVGTLEELAAYSKAHPKTLSYTAAAIPHQLFIEGFKEETHADIVRVPFRGGGEAVNGMLTGTTPVAFFGIGNFIAHLQAGTDPRHRGRCGQALAAVSQHPDLAGAASQRRSDPGRFQPVGAEGHAAGDHPQDPRRHGRDRQRSGVRAEESHPARARSGVQHARRVRPAISRAAREQVDRTAKKAGLQPQ